MAELSARRARRKIHPAGRSVGDERLTSGDPVRRRQRRRHDVFAIERVHLIDDARRARSVRGRLPAPVGAVLSVCFTRRGDDLDRQGVARGLPISPEAVVSMSAVMTLNRENDVSAMSRRFLLP
jgi:hypothetical protein